MKTEVTTNDEQRLYVIPCGDDGYSCLGFDVCLKRLRALAKEMKQPALSYRVGSMVMYNAYLSLQALAKARHELTGWRSKSQLTPELRGMEGKRVEVTTEWGEFVRFTVGKSTGFIPCHIMLSEERFNDGHWDADKDDDGIGGCAVCVGKPRNIIEIVG